MEKNKAKIISIVALIALVILIVGATYAYFVSQTGEGSQTDIRINANSVDTLTFEIGDPITLTLDQENFAEGKGNQTSSTFAKAMLTANSKTNTATEYYYMYLNISGNTFTYTQNENTPEILLTIQDINNNEITSINGLTYKTVTDGNGASIKGFDITTRDGLITILDNREITTTSSITEEWSVTVTYINYNADQSANAGKSFSAKLMVQKERKALHESCDDNTLACYIAKKFTGTQGENNIYFHDSTLANGAGDNSYRYAGPNGTCTYNGTEVQGIKEESLTFVKSIEENCNNVYLATSDSNEMLLDNSLSKLISDEKAVIWQSNSCKTTDGESINYAFTNNGFQEVTEETCKGSSFILTSDGLSFRITNLEITKIGTGKWENSTDNFVCFGSTTTPCPHNNLYRIIGVIDDKVKLIKYDYMTSDELGTDGDYYGSYPWIYDNYNEKNYGNVAAYWWNYELDNINNTWSTRLLNKTNLNTNFLNNIGSTWANKIATTSWKVGGNTEAKIKNVTPTIAYRNEIINPLPGQYSTTGETKYNAKIGLMYVSDYGFAASPNTWTTMNVYSNTKNNNWMYMGLNEWTITRNTDKNDLTFYLIDNGNIGSERNESYAVRVVFNLESSVTYKSGTGTMSDPYIID